MPNPWDNDPVVGGTATANPWDNDPVITDHTASSSGMPWEKDPVIGKPASPAPETEKAVAQTKAIVDSRYVDQSNPEQYFKPQEHPIAENVAGGVIDAAKGLLPGSVGQAAGMITPLPSAYHDITQGYGALKDWISGKSLDQIQQNCFPDTTALAEADKTPPFSRERFAAGFGTLAQMGMLAAGAKGLTKAEPKPAEATSTEIPSEAQPVSSEAQGPADTGVSLDQTTSEQPVGGELPNDEQQRQTQDNPTPVQTSEVAQPDAAPDVPEGTGERTDNLHSAQGQEVTGEAGSTPAETGISQAKTEAELGPGSVEPGIGAELGIGLEYGRTYVNKGGDPRLPVRRARASGMVSANDVGIVHAELERLRSERNAAAAALEADPTNPVLEANLANADSAQRAWRKELQPVLTKASDSLREAAAASAPVADPSTYQGLADMFDEHFKGEREITPEMRTAMAKAAKGVRDVRQSANGEFAKVEEALGKKMKGRKVMTPDELDADLRSVLEEQFKDCVLGA